MKVVAMVGMPGSGKSEAARYLVEKGFSVVRFGDITDEELKKQGYELEYEHEDGEDHTEMWVNEKERMAVKIQWLKMHEVGA